MSRLARIAPTLTLLLASSPAAAQWSGSATLTSDYVSRGVSQTQRGAALQLDAEFASRHGLYANTAASNVDFVAPGGPDDGVDLELALGAGWRHTFGTGVGLDLGAQHLHYPGAFGASVDYTEYGIALSLGPATVGLAHAPDYYGLGGAANDASLGLAFQRGGWSIDALAGYFDQHALAADGYPYVDVTATRAIGPVAVQLGWGGATRWSSALSDVNGRRELSRMSARVTVSVAF